MAKEKKELKLATLDDLLGFVKKGARADNTLKIPTGHFELDFAINFGTLPSDKDELGSVHKVYDPKKTLGIPCGRLVEIFGAEGSGKSSLCYRIVGFAQRMGYDVAWIDTEQSFSEDLAIINGVNLDELLLSDLNNPDQPDKIYYAEDVLDGIVGLIQSGIKVVVLDSVANLVPKERMEASAEQQFMARLARLLSDNLGRITQWAGNREALVICINQLRDKPGVMWGDPQTTPGGRMLKHNSSLRLEVVKRNSRDSCIFVPDDKSPGGQKLVGRDTIVKIQKNRFAKPLLDANGSQISIHIPIYYEPYFPDIEEIIFNTARQMNVVKVRTGIFSWKDSEGKKYEAEGRKAFIQVLKDNNLIEALVDALKKESDETKVPLPPEIVQFDGKRKTKKKVTKAAVIEAVETTDANDGAAEPVEDTPEEPKVQVANDEAVDVDDVPTEVTEVAEATEVAEEKAESEVNDAKPATRGRKRKDPAA